MEERLRSRREEDVALAARLKGRDEEALRQVIELFGSSVNGTARMIIGDPSRAEEVTQDTMLGLWNDPDAFDPARGSLRTYLVGIARFKAIDAVRRETARARAVQRATAEPNAVVERTETAIGRRLEAQAALGIVSSEQRQAIFLAYFAGLPYREVARHLGVPEGTIKTRIRDGLSAMREVLVEA